MPLARSLARRYRRGPEPLEDLEQVASLALLRAVDGFDPSRGLAFSSYAVPSITGALKRHYRDCGWSVRMPRDLQELALRIERFNEDAWATTGAAPTPAQIAERAGVSVEAVIEAREAHQALRADSLDQPLRSSEDDAGASLLDTLGSGDVDLPARLRSRGARHAARDARRARPDDRAALLPRGAHAVRDRPAGSACRRCTSRGCCARRPRGWPTPRRTTRPPRPERARPVSRARARTARAAARRRRRTRPASRGRASRGGRGSRIASGLEPSARPRSRAPAGVSSTS